MLSREAANYNFKVFALTRSRLEPMIYGTLGEQTIDASMSKWNVFLII